MTLMKQQPPASGPPGSLSLGTSGKSTDFTERPAPMLLVRQLALLKAAEVEELARPVCAYRSHPLSTLRNTVTGPFRVPKTCIVRAGIGPSLTQAITQYDPSGCKRWRGLGKRQL